MVSDNFEQLYQDWSHFSDDEKIEVFFSLSRDDSDELFLRLGSHDQKLLLEETKDIQKRTLMRSLDPDDLVDLLQLFDEEEREELLKLLDTKMRAEALALLAYQDDEAGGLMNTRFIRLRPYMTAQEALQYLRVQTMSNVETLYYAYVLDRSQKLLGVISLRQILRVSPNENISNVMVPLEDVVTIKENVESDEIVRIFSKLSFLALPVVNDEGIMVGIITVDDLVDVVQETATEDMHRLAGMEALDAPYFNIGFLDMLKKRAGWLLALFIGEMFTATAMGHYEKEIERAVVLALFIPLIISSGGNSGSQATTLIIRAMALGEVKLRDWFRVFSRELFSGLCLGLILGSIGLMRIFFWPTREQIYGEHYGLIAMTVGFSLIGIVTWGTISGSMLPFILKLLRLDPAVASAPFVSTLVDVTGIIIYFTIASIVLSGTLL